MNKDKIWTTQEVKEVSDKVNQIIINNTRRKV